MTCPWAGTNCKTCRDWDKCTSENKRRNLNGTRIICRVKSVRRLK